MKAIELRIGNLINYKIYDNLDPRKEWIEVSKIDAQDLIFLEKKTDNIDYQPISLTEEWLKKTGFFIIETNKCVEAFKENFRYSIQQVEESIHWFFCDGETVITTIQYVHQLQNLYFALTGTELLINEIR